MNAPASTNKNPTILLFLKAPVPGTVKTRLARSLGNEKAAEIFKTLVEHQRRELPAGWPVEVHFAPADARVEIEDWLGRSYHLEPQPSGDLGTRMLAGFQSAFTRGASSVIAIGGDCPGLTASHFFKTKELLDSGKDVVFGPASDGGYYLIAMRKVHPELFDGIHWSTAEVLRQSLETSQNANLSTALLPVESDVDELEDWEKVCNRFPEIGNQ